MNLRTTFILLAATPIASAAEPIPTNEGALAPDAQVQPCQTVWVRPLPIQVPAGDGRGAPDPFAFFLTTDVPPEADQPLEVAYLRDGSGAVIVHRDTDNVTFFDTATGAITDTVAVGDLPTDIAVSPDNRYVVVPNALDGTVSVIDVATRTVVATIPVTGSQPYSVEVSSDSALAVVGVINDGTASAFSIIDLGTMSEVRTIPTSGQGVIGFYFTPENGIAGELFTEWALSPDGRTIVLPDRASTLVNVYDAIDGSSQSIDTSFDQPGFLDISADGAVAVVGHESTIRRLTEIDLATRTVVGSFPVVDPMSGRIVRLTPDKSHAMAAISNNVIFVDLATGAETARIATGVVGDIELSFDGQYAFVSNFNARVIDVASRTLVATIPFAACANAATSPVSPHAVALNNRFRENIHLYDINPATASLVAWSSTGPAPEADAARDLAISPDGRTVVAANNISANVSIIDLASKSVRATIPTGDRPFGAAVTPDGRYAVVVNADEPAGSLRGTVSIIDLTTDTVVSTLTTHDRPSHVRISPDGQMAYVLTVAGSDSIYFIHLDGANSSIVGTAPAGQTGSILAVTYGAVSGIELSPDGSIIAVCASFDNTLNLIDTATRTRIATVPVGTFPMVVAFNPSGTRAYVANFNSDNLSVVEINGAASTTIATVPTGNVPCTLNVDPAGEYVYIGNSESGGASVHVLSTATNSIVASVPIGAGTARTSHLAADGTLYVGTSSSTGGALLRIRAAGAASSLIDSTPLRGIGSSLVFSESLRQAVLAIPGHIPDGVEVVSLCPADFDNDGRPTAADFAAFRAAFLAGDPRADYNGDGSLSTDDLVQFRTTFLAGCP